MCEFEDKRSHSYYIKQDFPEQSAPATELPKSSSGFPPQHKLCRGAESPLFVLEHHCSGAAEAMSQHGHHAAHLPRFTQLLNVWLLLCHLAFANGIYSNKKQSFAHSHYWLRKSRLLLRGLHVFFFFSAAHSLPGTLLFSQMQRFTHSYTPSYVRWVDVCTLWCSNM